MFIYYLHWMKLSENIFHFTSDLYTKKITYFVYIKYNGLKKKKKSGTVPCLYKVIFDGLNFQNFELNQSL